MANVANMLSTDQMPEEVIGLSSYVAQWCSSDHCIAMIHLENVFCCVKTKSYQQSKMRDLVSTNLSMKSEHVTHYMYM